MDRPMLDRAARHCHVMPGRALDLDRHAADWLPMTVSNKKKKEIRGRAAELLEDSRRRLAEEQHLLWASDSYSMLIILQGLDAAGKDGIVKHVVGAVNPMGCDVHAFKAPNEKELDHDFLWRAALRLPPRGKIAVFNRSYYEEVLVVRVHPRFLEKQRQPGLTASPALWKTRFRSIKNFEQHLSANGTVVRKFFLNVSPAEQRQRLIKRIDDPKKFWKFNLSDAEERAFVKDYRAAYQDVLSATSTRDAPWYVIPADRKWFARTLVAHILTRTIEALRLEEKKPTLEDKIDMAKAREILQAPDESKS